MTLFSTFPISGRVFRRFAFGAVAVLAGTTGAFAQTPTDGIMMGKHLICNVLSYSNSHWDTYWEGTLKRKNGNIGTFYNENVTVMSAYGLTKNLNVMAALPYVWTRATAGHFSGQKGLQDLSLWLKYRAVKAEGKAGTFAAFLTGGMSFPTTNYIPDMLPFSIGIRSRTASLKAILHYKIGGFYVTGHGGYMYRSNIHIDRDAYQANGKIYDTHEVEVPNAIDASARLGFINRHVQVEGYLENMTSRNGDDIRRQDMPFPTNKMDMTSVGGMAKVHLYLKNGSFFSVVGQYGRVIAGRNVGESSMYTLGIQHTFNVTGK